MDIFYMPIASIECKGKWLKAFMWGINDTRRHCLYSTLFCRQEKMGSYKDSKEINENTVICRQYDCVFKVWNSLLTIYYLI